MAAVDEPVSRRSRHASHEEKCEFRRCIAVSEQPAKILNAIGRPIEDVRGRPRISPLRFVANINAWREPFADKHERLHGEREEQAGKSDPWLD